MEFAVHDEAQADEDLDLLCRSYNLYYYSLEPIVADEED